MTAALALPDVTLVCVETRFPALARLALERSMAQVQCARSVLFTTAAIAAADPVPGLACELRVIAELNSSLAYSRFVLEDLPDHVETPFVLIMQWDGFVLDAGAWQPAFLDVDYVGALWPWMPAGRRVGNGGFSLRSTRLLHAVRRLAPVVDANEDLIVCHRLREPLEAQGLRFADDALARQFAYEIEPPPGPTFGFHGLPNFPRVFAPPTLDRLLADLPPALATSVEASELALRLLAAGRLEPARAIVRQRLESGLSDEDTRSLMLRCWQRTQPCWCGSGQAFRRCHGRLG